MSMNENHLNLLHLIYDATYSGGFITYNELQRDTGKTVHFLKAFIEDLKEDVFVSESTEGFQIMPRGIHFARSRWV